MDLSEGEMHVQTLKVMDTLVQQSLKEKSRIPKTKTSKTK